MSYKDTEDSKFSPRQLKFLELFFSGFSIKNAARAAGYRGSSDQALCNTGRAILTKFSKNRALFRRAGARKGRKIAELIIGLADNSKSELQQLKALKILSRWIGG